MSDEFDLSIYWWHMLSSYGLDQEKFKTKDEGENSLQEVYNVTPWKD